MKLRSLDEIQNKKQELKKLFDAFNSKYRETGLYSWEKIDNEPELSEIVEIVLNIREDEIKLLYSMVKTNESKELLKSKIADSSNQLYGVLTQETISRKERILNVDKQESTQDILSIFEIEDFESLYDQVSDLYRIEAGLSYVLSQKQDYSTLMHDNHKELDNFDKFIDFPSFASIAGYENAKQKV